MSHLQERALDSLRSHFQGQIDKHVFNVEVMLNHAVGVAEHPDFADTIEKELQVIAEYQDKLDVLNRFFGPTVS